MLKILVTLSFLIGFVPVIFGAYEADPVIREKNKARVDQIFQDNQKKHKNNSDILILPGLLADRKAKRLTILAEATGVTKGDPVEFFIVGESSGHGYEALAISFARPGDVQKALEFIGLPQGRASDSRKCLFWPKGERVLVSYTSLDADKSIRAIRAEKLVLDSRTRKTLPEYGLVFTGSKMIEMPDKPGVKVLAVDTREPHSIASTFNAFETIMDVPFSWSQKSAYGNILVNETYVLPLGCFLEITMEPEHKDSTKRIIDLRLEIAVKADSDGKTADDVEFHIRDTAGNELNSQPTLNGMLKLFETLNKNGRDPFVTIKLPDNITIKAASDICALLSNIDTEKGIRIEPPDAGHLYYRAFTPNEKMRNRPDRFAQPLELTLQSATSNSTVVLTRVQQIWKKESVEPELKSVDYPVDTPEEFQKKLRELGTEVPVIFVFADPSVTYGHLMSFIRPVLDSFPMIHVYIK